MIEIYFIYIVCIEIFLDFQQQKINMFILQFLKRFIVVFLGGIEMIVIFPQKN